MLLKEYVPALKYGAKIQPSSVLGVYTTGNVYYVIKETETFYSQFVSDFACTYSDGSTAICPDAGTVGTTEALATLNTGIQDALDKCVANRNDYVVILPSATDYDIGAPLAMDDRAVHLICPAGLGYTIGANNSARMHQMGDHAIIGLSAGNCEIAGLYFKNYVKEYVIDADTYGTCYAENIHNNYFSMIGTDSSSDGLPMIGSSLLTNQRDAYAYGRIERNMFQTVTGNSVTLAKVVDVDEFAVGCDIAHNSFMAKSGWIFTKAINNLSTGGFVYDNYFGESGGASAAAGETITKCITVGVTGNVINNKGAVGTGQMLTGGTTLHSYCKNHSAFGTATTLDSNKGTISYDNDMET